MSDPGSVRPASSADLPSLLARHDEDPDGVASALLSIDGAVIAAEEQWIYAFLCCHLLGEQQDRWVQADRAIEQALSGAADPRVLLLRTVAAHRAGRTMQAWDMTDALAQAGRASAVAARVAVVLGILQFAGADVPRKPFERRLARLVGEIADVDAQLGDLGRLLAAGMNNATSRLLEHPDADPASEDYAVALMAGAEEARRLWDRAGTWVHHERAHYLVAQCANRIGRWSVAREAAQAGIAILDRNGAEPVDRAFLLLELAQAARHEGDEASAGAALQEARLLADSFEDESWRQSFQHRAQPLLA